MNNDDKSKSMFTKIIRMHGDFFLVLFVRVNALQMKEFCCLVCLLMVQRGVYLHRVFVNLFQGSDGAVYRKYTLYLLW